MQPPDNSYSFKEVLELTLKPITDAIIDLKRTVEGGELKHEKRFMQLDKEIISLHRQIADLKVDVQTLKTNSKWYRQIGAWVMGLIAAFIASIFTVIINSNF